LFPEALSALSMVMLAQAQESVYIKASRDGLNASVLAKIASQCSELYTKAQALMAQENIRGMWEKVVDLVFSLLVVERLFDLGLGDDRIGQGASLFCFGSISTGSNSGFCQ